MTRLRHEGPGDDGHDRWTLELAEVEANIISSLPDQLEALLTHPDSNRRVIDRLFPVSYDDPEEESLNRQLLGQSLLDERKETLRLVREALADATRGDDGLAMTLDRGTMDVWLRFLNDVRLVIATDLGVEENIDEDSAPDPDHPDAPKYALMDYLGGMEAMLVEALTRTP